MRFAQLVVGPAGNGKSTYCSIVAQHLRATCSRVVDVVNLDPAADFFDYEPLVDIRELIHVEDAMEDQQFGPNGGLVFCIKTLLENSEWLHEQLGEEVDEDYVLFDCPGQIELYTHLDVMRRLVELLQHWNFNVCVVFLLDSQFMVDGAKFISGTMVAQCVMVNLELPHVNVLTKLDLLTKRARKKLDEYLVPDPHVLLADMRKTNWKWHKKYQKLTEAIGEVIEDYSLVSFHPLNIKDDETVKNLLLTIDNILQYDEDRDVRVKDFDEEDLEADADNQNGDYFSCE